MPNFQSGGVRIAYWDEGQGDPILLIHGFASNAATNWIDPGWVRTRMGGAGGKISVEKCVEGQQRILDTLTPDQSGRFFNYDGRELPW